MSTKSAVQSILMFALSTFVSQALAGNIVGKVNFNGVAPAVPRIKMNADAKCMKAHEGKDVTSDQVVVNSNKTLRWVFVYVKKGLEGKKFPTPSQKVTIDQKGCMYNPHVFGIMTNQDLEIVNNDPTLHNIHAMPKNSSQFNIGQPKQGMKTVKKFDKPEVMVRVKCDVHNWMAAWIGVLDHPFYGVSDDKGNFEIKNLPGGTYEIEAWHEKFGTQTMNVTVGASETKTSDFTFQGK